MQRVIVTVQHDDEARGRDLEIPAEMPSARLAELIVQALRWPVDSPAGPITYQIEADPPGRLLRDDETLADAGAWDGARLMLTPEAAPVAVRETAPVGFRWRRLGGPPDAEEPAATVPGATIPDPIGPSATVPDVPTGPGRSGSPFKFNPIPLAPPSTPPPPPSPTSTAAPISAPIPAPALEPAPEPIPATAPAPDEPPSRGFVWKQLDG